MTPFSSFMTIGRESPTGTATLPRCFDLHRALPTGLVARWTQPLQPSPPTTVAAGAPMLAGSARFLGFTVDLFRRHLIAPDGGIVALPSAEFMVLMAFIEAPWRVMSREHLARRALGRHLDATARTLDVYVSRLRRRLRETLPQQAPIGTVRKRGYVFNADVAFDRAAPGTAC